LKANRKHPVELAWSEIEEDLILLREVTKLRRRAWYNKARDHAPNLLTWILKQ
jgi:hypothetical protein